MVIWMANWIRLPARQSNSTYEAAVIVSRHTRHIVCWCARLASLPHITRRQQNYVREFNRRCEKRSPNGPCEMLGEMLSRCSQESSPSCERFFQDHHGIGWLSLPPSLWLQSSVGTYSLDCNDLRPINSWPRNS